MVVDVSTLDSLEKGVELLWMENGSWKSADPRNLSNFTSDLTSTFASHDYPLPLLQCQIHHPPYLELTPCAP